MGRIIYTLIFVVVIFSGSSAYINPSWKEIFLDTTVVKDDMSGKNDISTKNKIYKDSKILVNSFGKSFSLNKKTSINSSLVLSDETVGYSKERIRDVDGTITFNRDNNKWVSSEIFLNPQRSIVEVYDDKYEKKFRHNIDAGIGTKIKPYNNTSVWAYGKKIYAYDRDWDGSIVNNSGWGAQLALKGDYPFPLMDIIKIRGNAIEQRQEKAKSSLSFIHFVSNKKLDNFGNTISVALKHSIKDNVDKIRNLDEKVSNGGVYVSTERKIGNNIDIDMFGCRNWTYNQILRDVNTKDYQFNVLGRYRRVQSNYSGLIGYAKKQEIHVEDSLLSNLKYDLLMKSEFILNPSRELKLGWKGYGRKIASYFDNDTTVSNRDNDDITIEHKVQVSYSTISSCSLFCDATYSKNIIQYLRAKYSGGNRIKELYSLEPSVYWNIGEIFRHKQYFQIFANYEKNPFCPSKNNLYRYLVCTSVFESKINYRNKFSFQYTYKKSDLGNMNILDEYLISKKAFKHDWLFEWKRNFTESIVLSPGIGRIKDSKYEYINSDNNFVYIDELSGSSWIYSLKFQVFGENYSHISSNVSYINELDNEQYWDIGVNAEMGI